MTIGEFMNACEDSFGGKSYTSGQRGAIESKCSRFDERELNRIFAELLETCRYLPKIADIYDSARYLGMLHTPERPPHRWQPADCGMCHGEGRLGIIWHCFMEERPTGIVEIQELVQVFQYSKQFDYKLKINEYRSIFRCKCWAAEAETIPRGFPQWTNQSNARREKWL